MVLIRGLGFGSHCYQRRIIGLKQFSPIPVLQSFRLANTVTDNGRPFADSDQCGAGSFIVATAGFDKVFDMDDLVEACTIYWSGYAGNCKDLL